MDGTVKESTMRERILDAADACYAQYGIGKTTVEDVARAADLSRATVYRHFRTHDDLLLAVVAREAARTADEARRRLRRYRDVGSWIVEGLLFCLDEIPARPALARLFSPDALGAASRLVLSSEQLLRIGTDLLRPVFEPAREQGRLREGLELDALMEWVFRILVSYLAAPSHVAPSRPAMRRLLRRMILPAVLEGFEDGDANATSTARRSS
jgi:AcrR family transcriptional regulator